MGSVATDAGVIRVARRFVAIGVDVGQQRDPSAIVVGEHEERVTGSGAWQLPVGPLWIEQPGEVARRDATTEAHLLVRHLERLPLGMPYPQQADRLVAIVAGVKQRLPLGMGLEVRVDCTGVGLPVVDELRVRLGRLCPVVAVTFTSGERYERHRQSATLGKANLVSRLQVLLQNGRLHVAMTSEAAALLDAANYEIRVDANAHDTYGAFKTGAHDDLVTALGLAALPAPATRVVRVA